MTFFFGIDWSENKHDLCVLNAAGAVVASLVLPHTADGLLKLDALRLKLGVSPHDCLVALETAHNLVIDFLWNHGYDQVFVIPPSVTKHSRPRYRQSGAQSDPADAFILADLLRTDQHRFHPWRPDSLLTRQLRSRVNLIHSLTQTTVRLSNQLRAVLLRYYPAALRVFSALDAQITLHFILTYPSPLSAAQLSLADFKAFASQHHYPHPNKLPTCYARLQAAYPSPTPDTVLVYQDETLLLARLLLDVVQTKAAQLRELTVLFHHHPDAFIFSSLPGLGDFLAPALLSKFGDDRLRFPSPANLQALAGTCPVTIQSGKRRLVRFRKACDHRFRDWAQNWAKASLPLSVWAQTYWQQLRPHCDSNSHAYRCLANRWLAIAWKLWQSRQPYDEAFHLQQHAARCRPRV